MNFVRTTGICTLLTVFFIYLASLVHAAEVSVGEAVTLESELSVEQDNPLDDSVKVFGGKLFEGNFRQKINPHFNPDYRVAIGDTISLRVWGAYEFQADIPVDNQGNIFIPKVGTVPVAGSANKDLIRIIDAKVHKKYNRKVFVYANVADYQPVWVFVTGNVNKPGLYQGMASDSVLQFIDKAMGINLTYGSFRKISVVRNKKVLKSFDLYRFLIRGELERLQFHDGDAIVVEDLRYRVTVAGDVKRPHMFEFKTPQVSLNKVLSLALPNPSATNVTITHWMSNNKKIIDTYPLEPCPEVTVSSGDEIEVFADHNDDANTITIAGEHKGLHTLLLPKETTLADLIPKLKLTSLSEIKAIQVFRKSVAQTQKQLLMAKLKELESLVLTASAISKDDALMREQEAKSTLMFIERAKKAEPKGLIVINEKTSFDEIYLEDGDQIYIPRKSNLVLVQGEVSFPGAHTYVEDKNASDYIAMSGDFNERANKKRVLVIRQNGKVVKCDSARSIKKENVYKGDSILVLPKLAGKHLQITKDLTQIIYQIAVGAGVILAL